MQPTYMVEGRAVCPSSSGVSVRWLDGDAHCRGEWFKATSAAEASAKAEAILHHGVKVTGGIGNDLSQAFEGPCRDAARALQWAAAHWDELSATVRPWLEGKTEGHPPVGGVRSVY